MNNKMRDHISDALACLEKNEEGNFVRRGDNIRRFDMLMSYIVDEFPVNPHDIGVTRDEFRNEIYELAKDVWEEPNPVDEFEERYGEVISDLKKKSSNNYTIAFPLNITDTPVDEFQILDEKIERVDYSDWSSRFLSPAQNEDSFKDIIGNLTNDINRWQSFWCIEIESGSRQFAVEYSVRLIEIVLGQLQYSLFHWTKKTTRTGFNPRQFAWSELRNPFIYLVFEDGQYDETYYDTDLRERELIHWRRYRGSGHSSKYHQIPPFSNPNEVEQDILSAFRGYHRAVTEPASHRAFMNYWRALESLMLTEPSDGTGKVLHRSVSISNILENEAFSGLVGDQMDRLIDVRNKLAHEPQAFDVMRTDLEFLRALFAESMPFMIINRKWEKEKIVFWLDNAGKENVTQAVQTRKDRIHERAGEINLLDSIKRSRRKL